MAGNFDQDNGFEWLVSCRAGNDFIRAHGQPEGHGVPIGIPVRRLIQRGRVTDIDVTMHIIVVPMSNGLVGEVEQSGCPNSEVQMTSKSCRA